MPLSKEAQRAWQEQPPKREIHHDTVAPMTRFGRKWLWDLTLNVPVHLLAEALEGAEGRCWRRCGSGAGGGC